MKIPKKLRNLALGGLIALNSFMPLKAIAGVNNLSTLNTPIFNPDQDYQYKELKPNLENSTGIKDVVKEAPKILALWYLADAFRLVAHEEGHYDKANELGSDAAVNISFNPNGLLSKIDGTTYYYKNLNKKDAAKFNIAGLVSVGDLAETLKSDILF